MSILIGYGKTKTNDKNETYISGFLTEEFTTLHPEFKGLLINMKHIPADKRKTEKSPHWTIELFKPSDSSQSDSEEIPM